MAYNVFEHGRHVGNIDFKKTSFGGGMSQDAFHRLNQTNRKLQQKEIQKVREENRKKGHNHNGHR